jgi:hypothetical protein
VRSVTPPVGVDADLVRTVFPDVVECLGKVEGSSCRGLEGKGSVSEYEVNLVRRVQRFAAGAQGA